MVNPQVHPESLVAQLGLTDEQVRAALNAMEEARREPVALGDVIGALESIIRRFDEPEGAPAGAVMDALVEYRGLLESGIALRAFAAGLRHQQPVPGPPNGDGGSESVTTDPPQAGE